MGGCNLRIEVLDYIVIDRMYIFLLIHRNKPTIYGILKNHMQVKHKKRVQNNLEKNKGLIFF